MAVGVQKAWSTTAGDNDDADTNINYANGQTPASLNDSARAAMAATKGFANQISAAKTSGGSSNTYTFTSDSVAAISSAYAAGMHFAFKANHTNSGAATLNVDSVGAKSIKKGGAQSALAANDIVSGGIYLVYYEASGDCFVLVNPETGQTAAGYQPLDATLTAIAALAWSSGRVYPVFTAADTLTLVQEGTSTQVFLGPNGAVGAPTYSFTSDTDTGMYRSNADEISFALGGVLRLSLSGSAVIVGNTSSGNFRAGDGTTTLPGFNFAADTNTGINRIGSDNLGIVLGGAQAVDITAARLLLASALDIQLNAATGPGSTTSLGFRGSPLSTQDADYTFVLADAGKTIYHTSASTHTYTIPANASVAYPIGTMIAIENENGGGNVTIAITSDTLRWNASTGSRTLAANGSAVIKKVTSTQWRITGSGLS